MEEMERLLSEIDEFGDWPDLELAEVDSEELEYA